MDKHFCEFCLGVSNNNTLKAFSFTNNRLSPVSMKIFASIAKTNTLLQDVDFSHNNVGSEGVISLGTCLGRNKGL